MTSIEQLVNLICGESTEFTPQVLVSLIVVLLITDGIFYLIGSILNGGRK